MPALRDAVRAAAKAIALLCIGVAAAGAGAAQLQVLIDSDNDPATGCAVPVPGGSFDGAEWVLETSVDTTVTPPTVGAIALRDCADAATDTLGPPVPVSPGGWNVGVGQGEAGYDVIETFFVTGTPFGTWRLGFVYGDQAIGGDALVTTDGGPGGLPIVFFVGQPPGQIPTLSDFGLLLLAALLSGAALVALRRHRAHVVAVVAALAVFLTTSTWAAIVLDGLINDWTGTPSLATDALGDGPPGTDLAAAFAAVDAANYRVYFRADVKLREDQTVSFTSVAPGNAKLGGPTYNAAATATSGLPVALTIDAAASAVCSIAGSTVSFIGVGTCTVNANQAGNAQYNPAPPAQQSFAVGQGDQTITFTAPAPAGAKVGGPTYNVTATATSGLPVALAIDAASSGVCSIAGSTVSFVAVGTCTINANQAGNAQYNAAPQVQQTFAVAKGDQTISFTSTAPAAASVGGPTYNVTATATSGLPVAFAIDAAASGVCSLAGSTVSFIGAGTCVINANQPGNANYNAAPQVQQSFPVLLPQAITFTSTAPTAAVFQGTTYNVTATGGGSGNPVTFAIDATAATVCSIAAATVSFTGTGTCTINANQAGGPGFAPASQVQQSFAVGPNLGPDTYSVVGNTQLVAANHSAPVTPFTASPTTVLANDTANVAIALTTVTDAATANGGSITLAANGSFTYTPPAGFTGADTFVYTGTANGVARTATITFNVSGVVWYVDNAFVGAHDGRSNSPFVNMGSGAGNLGSALANTGPAVGAHIYVAKGTGTTSGAYAFKASQTLTGAGATLALGALSIPGNVANTPTLGGTLTLANNTTIAGIDVSTGASSGIVGASVTGLSVNVRNLTTTSATAVDLGGAGNSGTFTFRSITAGTGTGSAANGISLSNLTGSFTVTGDGTAAANGSGGTIQHMTGANGSTISGNGIRLTNVQSVALNQMNLHDFDNFAIRGSGVAGFTLNYSVVNGVNGNSAADLEGSVRFDNLTGSATIGNTSISGGFVDNLRVVNSTGSLDRLTFTSGTIGSTDATNGGAGILFEAQSGATTMKLTVNASTLSGGRSRMVDVFGAAGTSIEAVVTNNTAHNAQAGIPAGGGGVALATAGTLNFNVANNSIRGARGDALRVVKLVNATVNGAVSGNNIGNAGIANSGSLEGSGIVADARSQGTMNVRIANNTVNQTNNTGIAVDADNDAVAGSNPTANAIVTGNAVTQTNPVTSLNGLFLRAGLGAGDATTTCFDIGGAGGLVNDLSAGDANALGDIRFQQASTVTTALPGYVGGATDTTAITNYLRNRNANGGNTAVSLSLTGAGVATTGACVAPSFP